MSDPTSRARYQGLIGLIRYQKKDFGFIPRYITFLTTAGRFFAVTSKNCETFQKLQSQIHKKLTGKRLGKNTWSLYALLSSTSSQANFN